ncbi:MAG: cyclic nucleotide-binding domain-containing protein [Magnetospirillum sp.]|nr:cyclic nucleotide-binding domain-containing protein [Magnetospirillum sp.]
MAPMDDDASPEDILRFPRGAVIFSQGDTGDAAYVLRAGTVTLHQTIDGLVVELGAVEPGSIFGEMAIIDGGGRRVTTAVAVEDCVLTRVPYPEFRARLEKTDSFLKALIVMFINNIRNSHRAFLRRPRSYRDNVRQMKALSLNIRRFTPKMTDRAIAAETLEALERLDHALADLAVLAHRCQDSRHDLLIDPAESEGIGLKEVVDSESRRAVRAVRMEGT